MIPQAPTLPPVQKPPHDPRYLLLDARVGWRKAASAKSNVVEESSTDGALVLSPDFASLRPLADAVGTFGGLQLPTGVAMDHAGGIYLLDSTSCKIKRFDPCECRFDEVPCTGGLGTAPRKLSDPHGIAIHRHDLFVCDAGNERVQVFSLHGMTLRGCWLNPTAAKLKVPWKPFAIAFDLQGRAFVTDYANGVVHRFDRRGNWQLKFGGLNQPSHLAVDHHGRVYVAHSDAKLIAVFDREGNTLEGADRSDKIAAGFCPTGIETDRTGNLYLGARCSPPPLNSRDIVFDLHGIQLALTAKQRQNLSWGPPVVAQVGIYLSTPLDSEIYRCRWHSVAVAGDIPRGTSVTVETFTTEMPLDPEDLANVSDVQWLTRLKIPPMTESTWDCLITSPPGRFLYLRLTLKGKGALTPRLAGIKLYFPRVSLRRYLPAVFGENPVSADFTDRLLSIFDKAFRSVESRLDQFASYLDPMSAPARSDSGTQTDFLTWLASWMGLALEQGWDEQKRRRLLKEAHALYRLRGTVEGLRRHLVLFLGWEPPRNLDKSSTAGLTKCSSYSCSALPDSPSVCPSQLPTLILEHFKLRRWLFVGEARLGEQSVLWGKRIVNRTQLDETAQVGRTQLIDTGDPVRDPFHVYAHKFSVFIPAACAVGEDRRATVERIIAFGKPAHTVHRLELVEPRFRIGIQSTIGLDSVVGRYPRGFKLNDDRQPLGYGTVLSAEQDGAPSMQIGTQARIGTTTLLN